jgi:hypothetical protein
MITIASFGDSFIYGSELPDNNDGTLGSWPSLISQKINCRYECYARPGVGNEQIAQQVYSYINNNPIDKTVFVINWTWISRWDIHLLPTNQWTTLGPTCVPQKLESSLGHWRSAQLIKLFKGPLNSLVAHKYRSLQAIHGVHSLLNKLGAATIVSNMDADIFDRQWHVTPFINLLQNELEKDMLYFEGKNFLDWSRDRGYEITSAWHPLVDAHNAASELWLEHYKKVVAQLESNN